MYLHGGQNAPTKLQKSKSFKQSGLSEVLGKVRTACAAADETRDNTLLCISLFQQLENDGLLCRIMDELGIRVNTMGVRSLWLLFTHVETASVRALPLSPVDSSYANGVEVISSTYIEIPQSKWTDDGEDKDEDSECVRVLGGCLDQLFIIIPGSLLTHSLTYSLTHSLSLSYSLSLRWVCSAAIAQDIR
jgi:hypothetical protein